MLCTQESKVRTIYATKQQFQIRRQKLGGRGGCWDAERVEPVHSQLRSA